MANESGSDVTILVVDDNDDALFTLEQVLSRNGYRVLTAENGRIALEKAREHYPDIILSDVVMPELDGYGLAHAIKSDPLLRYIPVVLLTSMDSIESVIKGLGEGADDYIAKPYQQDELLARLKAAMRTRSIYKELESTVAANIELRNEIGGRYSFDQLIGDSSVMQSVYSLIERVSQSDAPVLISGESGTGKELVAKAIHYHSLRKENQLVVQNCSAFSENLLESELFGHVRGAFTGAIRDKQGMFEAAHGGTFFLDELGEMSLSLQAKLLRVLQDGTFTPVGSTDLRRVNVRIVAATNQNLEEMMAQGTFREDLYYRLNVVNISLPPLRDRRGDIPLLVDHFLKEGAREDQLEIGREALQSLCSYDWPGNIRELANEIERARLMRGTAPVILREHLSPRIFHTGVEQSASQLNSLELEGSLKMACAELEQVMIVAALQRNDGNKSQSARELGISRSSLISKVKSYGIE